MKFAMAVLTAVLATMPLASAQAADVLVLSAAQPTVPAKAAARPAPQPQPTVPEPLVWALLLFGGVMLAGATSRDRPEPRIRITFN